MSKSTQPKKKNRRLTVMVLDEKETRTMQLSAWRLNAAVPVIGILSVLLAAALAGGAYLWYAHGQQQQIVDAQILENEFLQQQVVDLRQASSEELESKISSLSQSEQSLAKLQNYLNSRGVKVKMTGTGSTQTGKNDAAGGPVSEPVSIFEREIPYDEEFADDVDKLLKHIQKVPLGRPAYGSISSRFGGRNNPFTGRGHEHHAGLDFRGRTGDPVHATAFGTVVFAGRMNGYGNLVKIRHGYGYETRYGHLSAISVEVGQKVQSGDLIGKIGSTGRSTGPHLHYEVRRHDVPQNPEQYLSLSLK